MPSKTHGMSRTRVYRIWSDMRSRCEIPSSTSYYAYGAKGIRVCDRWKSFENFYADMGDDNGLSLDRIDPTKNYAPDNCRWVDMKTQRQRQHHTLTHNGTPINKLAEDAGLHPVCVYKRLRRGWSIEEALSLPPTPTGHTAKR